MTVILNFLFLQLLPDLHYTNTMTVQCVYNGEGVHQSICWDQDEFIISRVNYLDNLDGDSDIEESA